MPGELLAGDREDEDDVGRRRVGDAAGAGGKLRRGGRPLVGPATIANVPPSAIPSFRGSGVPE